MIYQIFSEGYSKIYIKKVCLRVDTCIGILMTSAASFSPSNVASHMYNCWRKKCLMKKWQLVSQVWTHISDRSIGGAPWRSWHLCPFYSTPVTHPTMRCLCLLAHGVPKSGEKKSIIYKKLQRTFCLKSAGFFIFFFLFQKE